MVVIQAVGQSAPHMPSPRAAASTENICRAEYRITKVKCSLETFDGQCGRKPAGPPMPRYVQWPHLQVDTLDLHLIGLKCGSQQLCLHAGQRDIHLQGSVGVCWGGHSQTTQLPPNTLQGTARNICSTLYGRACGVALHGADVVCNLTHQARAGRHATTQAGHRPHSGEWSRVHLAGLFILLPAAGCQRTELCICRELWLPVLQVQVHPILERWHRTATGHAVARNVLPACSQGTGCVPMLWLIATLHGRPPLQSGHRKPVGLDSCST